MHAIRSAARRVADRSSGQNDNTKYNPWRRWTPNGRPSGDVEKQLNHSATENDAISPTEDKRRSQAITDIAPYARPPKASTFNSPRDHLDVPSLNGDGDTDAADIPTEPASEKPAFGLQTDSAPAGSLEHTVSSTSKSGSTRKRRGLKKYFKHSSKNVTSPDTNGANNELDNKKDRPKLTFASQFKAVMFAPINILLVFVPVGIAVNYTGVNPVVVFVLNFIAIIPLAAMLSYATEELAMYIGEVFGGLLNASFGNAVELIVGIIALKEKHILIVQTSLIGSMLSNLLLVLGMSMAAGGMNRKEQHFNTTVAQTAASLLALAIGSLVIPTAFQLFETPDGGGVTQTSRGTAVILLIVYACYLIFQLRTHTDMYNAPSQKTPKTQSRKKEAGEAKSVLASMGGAGAPITVGEVNKQNIVTTQEDGEKTPQLTKVGALTTLTVSTVFVALCSEYLVSSITAVSKHISMEFIGLILLPIVGNAAEHAAAVTVAVRDKMDLSIGVAIGSSLQIALLVLPIMILLNWFGVGSPADLTLAFDGFQVSALFIAIIIVNYVVQDGKSNWLEGVMLQATYIIIAVSAWFYPASPDLTG